MGPASGRPTSAMVPRRPSPRRALRRVNHLQITNELRGRRLLELGQESDAKPSGPYVMVEAPPLGLKPSRHSPRRPTGSRGSSPSGQSLDSMSSEAITPSPSARGRSTGMSTERYISTSLENSAARARPREILEPFLTPVRQSAVQRIVTNMEDGTRVTTFVMTIPASNRSADSNGFRSPFQRDSSPPLTPSDADSTWRESQNHVDEVRREISRLLGSDSISPAVDDTSHRQILIARSRSNTLESCFEKGSAVSILYATSDSGNDESEKGDIVYDSSCSQDEQKLSFVHESHHTSPVFSPRASGKQSVYTRKRGNSSASMIAMLAPASQQNLPLSIGRTKTARFFLSGSRACRKLVSRIGILEIFNRRPKDQHPSVQSKASSEASTLCTYIDNVSALSDGRNLLLNSSSHVESIWSVERDATIGASSTRHGGPMDKERVEIKDTHKTRGFSTVEDYSRETGSTNETVISCMSSGPEDNGCDRYLRLCRDGSDETVRPPTAGYYEDPTDPNSYYRPEHTQSDIDNDVPAPPSGRCTRPTFYTTVDPDSPDAESGTWTVRRISWQGPSNHGNNLTHTPVPEQRSEIEPSSMSVVPSASAGSAGTVIRQPSPPKLSNKTAGRGPAGLATLPSMLERLSFVNHTGDNHTRDMEESGSTAPGHWTSRTLLEAPDRSLPLLEDISQLPTVPRITYQVVADTENFNVFEERIQHSGSGLMMFPQDPNADSTKNDPDAKVQKRHSWIEQLSLKVKASVRDFTKGDSGYSTDRQRPSV